MEQDGNFGGRAGGAADVVRFLGGGALVGLALARRGWSGIGLALGGGLLIGSSSLLRRACAAAEGPATAGRSLDRPPQPMRFGGETRDLVEEASWESFPASDPPAY